jgi:hypothetical protein
LGVTRVWRGFTATGADRGIDGGGVTAIQDQQAPAIVQ